MHPLNQVKGEYVRELLNKGVREEGRDPFEYRQIKITHSLLPNAEGSAQVEIGNTRVLVGIKLDVATPMPDKPNEGNLMTMAELLPLASPEYEPGPPSPDSIELARVVDRGIRASSMVDLGSLFIEEEKVWSLFVDIYVLNFDGNLFDACMLAAVAALSNTRMPKYENGEAVRTGELGRLKTNNIVTSCTFAKVGNKILLDPDGSEEAVADARITIANDEKVVRSMQKGLAGAFSQEEVEDLIGRSFDKSKELRGLILSSKSE
ncbi:MAG: exosome complex protein Rrp42 [Candidatus Micrarchaeota archaeon]|nr:exosome complex protein Rrp42 [Candidatus Micrarchaeota archaeon]MDE1847451.1 exosome complex protein Rrp42 [Candidatus Micrarchaeota archaeon]MDE1864054.1 exosome complex protein Rrp42 [Candidatus Micrarchaeota archaeon]